MGHYRARDLVNAPTLVSFVRVPLAMLFPFVRHDAAQSLVVLGLAAGTDILDGFIARRFGLATPTGAVVDGVTDKIFASAVLATLVMTGMMPFTDVLLLGMREIFELPLVIWIATSHTARGRKIEERANLIGKAATVLQFAAIVATIVHSPARPALIWATVVVGTLAALSYWRRALPASSRRAPT